MTKNDIQVGSVLIDDKNDLYKMVELTEQKVRIKYYDKFIKHEYDKFYDLDDITFFLKHVKPYSCPRHSI